MKLHSVVDCITNSSSTTFIIGLKKKPKTMGQLLDLLYPDNFIPRHVVGNSAALEIFEALQIIFNDIQEAEEMTEKEILELTCRRGFPGRPSWTEDTPNKKKLREIDQEFRQKYLSKDEPYPNWTKHPDWDEVREPIYEAIRLEREEKNLKAAKQYIKDNQDKLDGFQLYKLEYGNELGEASGIIEGDYWILDKIVKLELENR